MTLDEVAALLRVSERTVSDWANKGELPGGKLGTSWRFKRSEVERWLNRKLVHARQQPRSAEVKLDQLLPASQIRLLAGKTKEQALAELVDAIVPLLRGCTRERLAKAIAYRETLMSTGIGLGIAIPHTRLSGVDPLTMVLGVHAAGLVDYESLDGEPVHIICMIVAERDQHHLHLRALAEVSRRLKNLDLREALCQADDAEQVRTLLMQADSA